MEKEMDAETKEDSSFEKLRTNPWILSTFVLGIFVVILLVTSLSGTGITGNAVSEKEAASIIEKSLGYPVDSVEEFSGLYQANVLYQGALVPVHVTKDGKFIASLSSLDGAGSDSGAGGSQEPVKVEANVDDDPVLGNANAPVTIIEFSDYQCPFCERFWSETLPLIKSKYIDTGKAKLVYRDFPLNFHPMAQPAAEAAECVRKVAKSDSAYYKYHDKIFENQAALSEDNLKLWATQMGYNIASCLDSGEMADEVLSDMGDGQAAGISGTPGFVINGILLSGAQPFAEFEKIIEGELSKSG